MKLLQVPTAHLEERIKEELEENPALETGEDGHDENFEEPKMNLKLLKMILRRTEVKMIMIILILVNM